MKPEAVDNVTPRAMPTMTSRHDETLHDMAIHHSLRVMLILSALMGFTSISTDLYLPALPRMANALQSDPGTMELTITGYLIGYTLGQLGWGPIGDRYGRRGPIAVGLILFIVGSGGCALSNGAAMMIAWRVVQALGACASVVLARAMVRDLYDRDRAAQMLSTLIVIMAIAPLLGPLVGAQILLFSSWRTIFWVLVGVGLATLGALFTLPETLPLSRRTRTTIGYALSTYAEMIRHRQFMGFALAGGFFYAGVWAFIAATPFVYIAYYHVPASLYGFLFGANIVAIMAMNMVNVRLVIRVGSQRLLRVGATGAGLSAMALAVATTTGWGGLPGLFIPLFIFASMSGLIVANSIAGALSGYPDRAGAASALAGSVQSGMGIIGSALVGIFADATPRPLGWVTAAAGVGSLLCARFLVVGEPSDRQAARSASAADPAPL